MPDRTCRHPECTVTLHGSNTSGVCRAHNHSGYCRCVQCGGSQRSIPRTARGHDPAGASVQTVHVPYATTTSGSPARAPVSLPRAPWDPTDA